jgi:hypothetical protein
MSIFVDVMEEYKPPFGKMLLQGEFIKSVVRRVLEESGYMTFPYGYESFLTFIKRVFQEKKARRISKVAERIASAPDLIVYSPGNQEVWMVEVKSKNWDPADRTPDWDKSGIDKYQRFWPESVIVFIMPSKHWYYAQIAEKIKLPKTSKEDLDITKEFRQFEEVFSTVKIDAMYEYKHTIAEIFGIFGHNRNSSGNFPENVTKDWDHNEDLLRFIRGHRGLDEDGLYTSYIRENLVSRKKFDENMKTLKDKNLL